ncbi:MAG: hypothetical protein M9918_20705 [Anaerolineae bacterium]|nr:hypothetical protein [Anaerolineae bacterium]
MNVIVLAAAIAIVTILLGFLFMVLFTRFSVAVERNSIAIETEDRARKAVNPQATAGFAINLQGDSEEQLRQARLLAAKQAAALPRGGNLGIGRLDTTDARENKKTASKGVESDPITAVKIAKFHTWQGLQIDRTQVATPTAAATGSTKMVKRKLEPGKDYPVTEITDSMSPQEKRAARVANAKAKSAAYKALKESGQMMVAETVATPAAAPATAAVPAAATAIPEPEYIEITDDMSADDKRKARIANSKAKSAYNKALKAAGVDPSAVSAAASAPTAPAATPAEAQPETGGADVSGIPKPELIEITDDMAPEDIRAARIANSKATSAYKKALKAAGIDPSSVTI